MKKQPEVECVLIELYTDKRIGDLTVLTIYYKSGRMKEYYADTIEEILATLPHKERYKDFKMATKKSNERLTAEWWKPKKGGA